jgi:hypothetical protein
MSNTEALIALKQEITVGWRVKIIDHDYINDSRDDVTVTEVRADHLTLRPKRAWSSQGRSFPTMNFTWGGDRVVDGRTVRLYHTPAPHTGKSRRLIKTFVFSPPKTSSR